MSRAIFEKMPVARIVSSGFSKDSICTLARSLGLGYRGETGCRSMPHEYYMIGVTATDGSRGVLTRPG